MATTQSRPSRAFANYAMPAGSGDMTQQQSIGGSFPAPLSYGSKNIWNHPSAHTRDRSIASVAAVGESTDNPSGSSALSSTAEPSAWSWNNPSNQTRSDSTSPNHTRDNGNLPSYFEQQAAVGSRPGTFPNGASMQDDSNGHPSFVAQARNSQEGNYLDSVHSMAGQSSRDASLPPSRQSQGSPVFPQDMYRTHNPSNSIHSQRAMHGSSASFSANQSANHRAFNMNRQVDGDITPQLGAQISRGGSAAGSRSFNPATQPFQRTQGSQAWSMDENNAAPAQGATLGYTDQMNSAINQFAALKGPAVDRASPVSGYRLDGGNSDYRGFAPRQDVWNSRPSSRDPRSGDFDRRGLPTQSFAAGYSQGYYPNQFQPYMQQQFAPNFIDPYSSTFRQNALNNYAMPQIHPGYPVVNGNLPTRPSRDQDPGKGMRSAVLEEFRNCNKHSRKYELRDIYGHVVEFSGDQHGSRFIQEKLTSANSDEKDQVFLEIEPNAIQLMKDVFGNYVVQKFFEHGSQVQKKMLAEKMKGQVVALSMQVYACRVVQKALEHVLVEQQAELTKELESEVLKVIRDANGNHVVQKIVELVPRQHIDFIVDAMRGNISTLSAHSYGCRVVQRMLEYGFEEDKAQITKELHASSHLLITDQFGNYVAQHVITHGKPEDSSRFIEVVLKDVLTLSKHKFASNVVESCIEKGSPDQRKRLYETFTSGDPKTGPLPSTLKDQYGNYVICTLLNRLETDVQDAFLDQLKEQLDNLKQSGFSRQLQNLEKLVGPMAVARDARLRQTGETENSPTPAATGDSGPGGESSKTGAQESSGAVAED